jgi:hypothetical protein
MPEQFIGESIQPVKGSSDTVSMAAGGPGLPGRFRWRGDEYAVKEVLDTWRELSSCRHGSAEQYVRKHWFRVRTSNGGIMKLYFERQARSKREAKRRWWLYSREEKGR